MWFDFNVGRIAACSSFSALLMQIKFKISIAVFYVHIIPNALYVVIPFHRFDMKKKKKEKRGEN